MAQAACGVGSQTRASHDQRRAQSRPNRIKCDVVMMVWHFFVWLAEGNQRICRRRSNSAPLKNLETNDRRSLDRDRHFDRSRGCPVITETISTLIHSAVCSGSATQRCRWTLRLERLVVRCSAFLLASPRELRILVSLDRHRHRFRMVR